MFIGLSKTFGKIGKFRFGAGLRITKKNAWWMALIVAIVFMFQLMWYMFVLCGWLCYAICYGIFLGCKALYGAIKKACDKKAGGDSGAKPLIITIASVAGVLVLLGVVGAVFAPESAKGESNTTEAVAAAETSAEQTTEEGTTLSIVERAKQLSADETTAEETETTVQTPTTTQKPTTTAPKTTVKPTTTAKPDNSRTVYITPSGTKYHYDKECAGDNAIEISLNKAIERGYGPCGTCVE